MFSPQVRAQFRHIRAKHYGVPWPSQTFADFDDAVTVALRRIHESSGLYQMSDFLIDLIVLNKDGSTTYYEEIPLPWAGEFTVGAAGAIAIKFMFSSKDDWTWDLQFDPTRVLRDEGLFIHPVLTPLRKGIEPLKPVHIQEDLPSTWTDPKIVDAIRRGFKDCHQRAAGDEVTLLAKAVKTVSLDELGAELGFRAELIQIGSDTDSKALVLDLPQDSASLKRWQRIASQAHYTRPEPGGFPGVLAELPRSYVEEMTGVLANVVQQVFGKKITADRFDGFFGQVCQDPGNPGLAASQYLPHVDGRGKPTTIVAVHYLADENTTWPFGGGTGFYRHRKSGFDSVSPMSCKGSSELGRDHFAALCNSNDNATVDSSKEYPGVTGDYGEYDLVHTVGYRANRIVLYYENQLHSGIITPKGSEKLNCDPNAEHRRTAASYFWRTLE